MQVESDRYKELANAIYLRAVRDYAQALASNDTVTVSECERFFKSAWGMLCSKLSSEAVIPRVKRCVREFQELANETAKQDTIPRKAFSCPICGGSVSINPKRTHAHCRYCKLNVFIRKE